MDWIRYGPKAVLLRFAQRPDEGAFLQGRAWLSELKKNPPHGLVEIVPALTTILLLFSGRSECDRGFEDLSHSRGVPVPSMHGEGERRMELAVRYGGPDLERVATRAGMSVADVIREHSAPWYRVHCLGFSPGFPYLWGLNPQLHTPRLVTPRLRVPAGSVAIGGEQSGIYSIASPGGWNLIGSTRTPMFRPDAASVENAFHLRSGDWVRFLSVGPDVAADEVESAADVAIADSISQSEREVPSLRILSVGAGLSIQDEGRSGFLEFGVPPGGAMDPQAAAWANRLLDNPPDAPVLELCLQGQRFEVLANGWLAWTGGERQGSSNSRAWSAFRVSAGEALTFASGPTGVWSYLAVPGGFVAPRLLGSVSANPRAGIGAVSRPGTILCRNSGARFSPPSALSVRRPASTELPIATKIPELPVWPGPHWELFSDAQRDLLLSSEWIISSQCDRVGYRLQGPAISSHASEMISEPVLPGSLQVPPNGQPIVTMPDGPTLGGYRQIGLLEPAARARLSQCRPGQRIRFVRET